MLVSHSANAGFLPSFLGHGFGQVGVAIFYAQSGFLMAHVTSSVPFHGPSVRKYLLARASRVLPLYFLVLTASTLLLLRGLALYSLDFPSLLPSWALLKAPSVLWSIPVEVQFYLVFLLLWSARTKDRLFLAMLVLTMIQLAQLALMPWGDDAFLPFWLHFFLIGVTIRTIGQKFPRPGRWSWIVLAGMPLLPPVLRPGSVANWYDLYLLLMVPLLLWCCWLEAAPFRWFGHPVLAWLGSISFRLYLLHYPVVGLVYRLHALPRAADFPAVLGISIALAAMSRYLLEAPAQRFLRRNRQKVAREAW